MENNNEIINNSEEVMATATEEIVKATSTNSSFSNATKNRLGYACRWIDL